MAYVCDEREPIAHFDSHVYNFQQRYQLQKIVAVMWFSRARKPTPAKLWNQVPFLWNTKITSVLFSPSNQVFFLA